MIDRLSDRTFGRVQITLVGMLLYAYHKSMSLTTIKVTKDVRDRVSKLARLQHMSQHAYLDQLLREAEEKAFWRGMAEASAEEYDQALAEDGDALNEDYALEESVIEAEERHD